jgi:hypothetical protein
MQFLCGDNTVVRKNILYWELPVAELFHVVLEIGSQQYILAVEPLNVYKLDVWMCTWMCGWMVDRWVDGRVDVWLIGG